MREKSLKYSQDDFFCSVSELLVSLEEHLHDACDVLIKKVDKKKDKQLVFAHRQSLLEQIEGCEDPSQLLLLACLVIYQFQVLYRICLLL